MNVTRKLLKIIVVLAVAAAALGGAAALGSTLFREPPRDAAEFSKWVAAGSAEATDDGRPARARKAKRKAKKHAQRRAPAEPSAAEARYGRALSGICRSERRALADLAQPATLSAAAVYLQAVIPIGRDSTAAIDALAPPPRFQARHRRLERMAERGDRLLSAMLRAVEKRDRARLIELSDEGVRLGARGSELAVSLGARGCDLNLYVGA